MFLPGSLKNKNQTVEKYKGQKKFPVLGGDFLTFRLFVFFQP